MKEGDKGKNKYLYLLGKTVMGQFYNVQREGAEEIPSDVGFPLPHF